MENNGRGIFYGVIGVATLVVAIIGATFAYFSASAGGNQTVTAGGATIDLKWSENTDLIQDNLVPVETGVLDGEQETLNNTAAEFAAYTNLDPSLKATTWCQDKAGVYNVCSAYTITLTNDSTAPITLDGAFTTVALAEGEKAVENLRFAIFRGTAAQVFATSKLEGDAKTGWDVNGDAKDAFGTYFAKDAVDGSLLVAATAVNTASNGVNNTTSGNVDALDVTIPAHSDVSFTIMMWIEEIGVPQKSGGKFVGKVNFTTADGTGITGLIA